MKKSILLFPLVCLLLCCCTSPTSKVKNTYFKTIVSQEAKNPDESLVQVEALPADSLKTLIVEGYERQIGYTRRGLDACKSGRLASYYSEKELKQEIERHEKDIKKYDDAIEKVKAADLPQYYLCKYNGDHYEYVATEDAATQDDFMHLSSLVRKISDSYKSE